MRKQGKLPHETERIAYALEYGSGILEMHRDAYEPPARVLVVDDVLATGGTAAATSELIERIGGEVVGFSFLIGLSFLHGREKLGSHKVSLALTY